MRDIVIGMSDGLTVPFALAAGLSGAVSSTHIVITAGLAEVAAGSIAMGLGAYVAGGLIPLSPYFVFPAAHTALLVSMIVALLIFGYVKGRFTGARPIRSALQTAIVGGLAATTAFLIARAIT